MYKINDKRDWPWILLCFGLLNYFLGAAAALIFLGVCCLLTE
jgi:hypothetical protein